MEIDADRAPGENPPGEVTRLLVEWTGGDESALHQLVPLVYDDLSRRAHRFLHRERPEHTLQTAALVHEAYLRLIDQSQVSWRNRAHFFGVASQMMRRILVDHARSHAAAKRGGDRLRVTLSSEVEDSRNQRSPDLLALEDCLAELAAVDPQAVKLVELRYFGGLGHREAAEVLGVSVPTVHRRWRMAKAWLRDELSRR